MVFGGEAAWAGKAHRQQVNFHRAARKHRPAQNATTPINPERVVAQVFPECGLCKAFGGGWTR